MARAPIAARLRLRIADHVEACPPAPAAGAQVWRDVDSSVIAWGEIAGAERVMHWPGLASFRFSAATDEIVAVLSPGAPADVVRDTWLRSVVPMALQALGHEALHASAVLTARGVVAFCARSHTGKSTLAFGLARRGYAQWADDAVVLDGTHALPLPFSVRLRTPSAAHYGESDVDYREIVPGDQARPLSAAFVLERTTGNSNAAIHIERLVASSSFVSLLTHAYCFDPSDPERRAAMMANYLEVAAQVPVLRLVLPNGLSYMPTILDEIEQAMAESGCGDAGSGR